MVHRLNTNKQFMIGNGILAFGIFVVVAIFIYISLRAQRDDSGPRYYNEVYAINLVRGFDGDSLSIFINDSLLANRTITDEPFRLEVGRFEDQSSLLIVDNITEKVSVFELSEKGGTVSLVKNAEGIKQLAN